eukprot:COSAG01_NODE_25343_length_748_cov_0.932203_2_plen_26_part_01
MAVGTYAATACMAAAPRAYAAGPVDT